MRYGRKFDYPIGVYIFLIISGLFLTILLSVRGTAFYLKTGWVLSFFIYGAATVYFRLPDEILKQRKRYGIVLALIFSGFATYYILLFAEPFWQTLAGARWPDAILDALPILLPSCAFFVLFVLFYFGVTHMIELGKSLWRELDFIDCLYLFVVCGISAVGILMLFQKTNVFYDAEIGRYDVVYTSDSIMHFVKNTFTNINGGENDIRQPLYGLLSLPFSCLAWLLSVSFPWMPQGYFIFFAWIQSILMHIGFILISRVAGYHREQKFFYYGIACISYTVLINTLMIEQYVLAFFWLAAFLYGLDRKVKHLPVLFLAAAGSLITSAFFYPFAFISRDFQKTWRWLLQITFLIIGVLTVFGQLPLVLESIQSVQSLMRFAGYSLPFTEKCMQYSHFVWSMFFAPETIIHYPFEQGRVSYQLASFTSYHFGGICILLFALLSFCLNYKRKIIQISFCWMLFSFFLMCVLGWGTKENGLVLYTLYFFWAFLLLVYEGIVKISAYIQFPLILPGLCLMAAMGIKNYQGLQEIIWFGLKFFPLK